MASRLMDTGSIGIEEDFVPDSLALFAQLESIPWDERIRARRSASFGRPYNYSGIVWPDAPFPDLLVPLLDRLAARLGYRSNNCLANYYPDGDASMGLHSDSTEELVEGTGIAVVSLGAERVITFRNQLDRQRIERYPLRSGSLLYMSAAMQRDWKHGILASDQVAGGRISLTFRCLKPGESDMVCDHNGGA